MSTIDVLDAPVDADVAQRIETQIGELSDGIARLAELAESKLGQKRPPPRTALAALPAVPFTIFCEFDGLAAGEVEGALLAPVAVPDSPAPDDANGRASERDARVAAYEQLQMTLDDAVAACDAAGAGLAADFIEFAEACCVHRVRLCVLSRGLKPLIRQLLRDQGLGHVEVLANDMFVERASGAWKVSCRDDSASGHDKGDSVRRAIAGAPKGAGAQTVLLVGRTACDFAPVAAGRVDCLTAPAGSELAKLCAEEGVDFRPWAGWDALRADLLP